MIFYSSRTNILLLQVDRRVREGMRVEKVMGISLRISAGGACSNAVRQASWMIPAWVLIIIRQRHLTHLPQKRGHGQTLYENGK